MCPSMNFSPHFSQRYDSNAKTLSVAFKNSAGEMSMIFLSASVSHNRQQAVAEFLVWVEQDGTCGEVMAHGNCMSATVSFFNLSCSAHGIRVPAHIEAHSFELYGHPRERVVSCTFNSSFFSHDDNAVDIYLDDVSSNLRARVPMCMLPRERQIRKIVACSQPIYNARFLETLWPGVLQAWVLYHV